MNEELLKLVKESLSILPTSTLKDKEIIMWINAAKRDLERVGIDSSINDELIQSAIVLYVKSNFGNVEEKDKENCRKSYSLILQNLSLSEKYKLEE